MPRIKRKFGDSANDAPSLRFSVFTWIILGYNVVVNIGLPVIGYMFLVPYIVQQLTLWSELGPVRILGNIVSNNPLAAVLMLPAALLGLVFPLYGWSSFLIVYTFVEAVTAWIQLSVGVLSVMACAHQIWMFTLFQSHVAGASWLALIAGTILIGQSVLMMVSAGVSKVMYNLKIRHKHDEIIVLKAKNRDSKLLVLGFHIADLVVHTALAILFGFLYFADKGLNIDGVSVFKLLTNGLVFGNAMFSVLVSLTAIAAFSFIIVIPNYSLVVPAIFGFVDIVVCLVELVIFLILLAVAAGRTYLKFFDTPADEIQETPLSQIFSFLLLALFKILPIVSSFEFTALQHILHRTLVSERSKRRNGKYEIHNDVFKLSSML